MVHAKAASAARADGSVCAYLGSANLKERSLTQFGELLMRAEGEVAAELQQALLSLYEEAEEVTGEMLRHDPTRAAVETWLG
jgi:phosphatidylserine/phosphatidylglycerophosphate/cardiolipin synthase-like enzyme